MKRFVLIMALLPLVFGAVAIVRPDSATAASWVRVCKTSGTGIKKTRPFKLNGGEQKIVYTIKASQPKFMIFQIYVTKVGSGFPDDVIQSSKTGKHTSYMYLGGGRWYLEMNTANCSWVVQVYEKR